MGPAAHLRPHRPPEPAHPADGEIVAIVGANGAGKTTLLSTIVGLVRARAGRITFAGRDITHQAAHRLPGQGLALVPEGGRLFPFMTVEGSLERGAFWPSGRAGLKERLAEVMETFPVLRERRAQLAGKLSGGERQMCAIARPDERSDAAHFGRAVRRFLAAHGERVFDVVVRLARERRLTGVLIEQNVIEALDVADRGYVLDHGHIVREGEAKTLRHDREIQEA